MKHMMKFTIFALAVCLCLPTLAGHKKAAPVIDGAEVGVWTQDYDAAKKLAKEKKLPLFVTFTGSDWCGWCQLMEKNVFSSSSWEKWAKKNIVLVWLDFPSNKDLVPEKYVERNKQLASEFGVRGFPTYIILDSEGKERLGKMGASREATPKAFIEELEEILSAKPAAIENAVSEPTAPSKAPAVQEGPTVDGAEVGVWTHDYDAAKKLAKEKKLPLFINFTGSDWCYWCKLMDKSVFSTAKWQEWAKKNIVLVWIDFPSPKNKGLVPQKYVARNEKLQNSFGVEGYPTYIILDSDGETKKGTMGASRNANPETFIKELEGIISSK